jgi:hypothetical protein
MPDSQHWFGQVILVAQSFRPSASSVKALLKHLRIGLRIPADEIPHALIAGIVVVNCGG